MPPSTGMGSSDPPPPLPSEYGYPMSLPQSQVADGLLPPSAAAGCGAPELGKTEPVTVKTMATPRQASPGPNPVLTVMGAPCSSAGCSSARSGSSGGGCYAGGSANFPNVVAGSPLLRPRAAGPYFQPQWAGPQVTYFQGAAGTQSPEREGRSSSQGPVVRNVFAHSISWCPPRLRPGPVVSPWASAATPAAPPLGPASFMVMPAAYPPPPGRPTAMYRASSSSAERRSETRTREPRATTTPITTTTTPARTAVVPVATALAAAPSFAAARPSSPRQGLAGGFASGPVPAGRLEQHLAPDGTYLGPEDRYPNVEDLRLAVEEARRERLSWELQVALRKEHLETARLQAEAHALDGVLEENTRHLADRLTEHRDDLLRSGAELSRPYGSSIGTGPPPTTTGEVGRAQRSSMVSNSAQSDTTLPPGAELRGGFDGLQAAGAGGEPPDGLGAPLPAVGGDGPGQAWSREETAQFAPSVQPGSRTIVPGRRVIMRTAASPLSGPMAAIPGWQVPMQQGGLAVGAITRVPPPAA